MTDKREILILLRKKYSIRKISQELNIHRKTVRSIRTAAIKKDWLNPNIDMPSDHEIAQIGIAQIARAAHPLDTHAEAIKQWRSEGMSAMVMQRLLEEMHSSCYGIGALRRYIRKICPEIPDPVMVRATVAGDTMEVDFAFLGYVWDESLGKPRKAWVFSGRLRHSRRAYRKMVWKQDVATFLMCHVHAFEYFGGVPYRVVLDNLKAGVIKSCVDNDMLNRSYKELAECYGFMISPCLPRTPQHKGGVENDMNYIKQSFWPVIREKQKTRPHLSLNEAQENLEKWNREVADIRKINGIGRFPAEIFEAEERITLQPLPAYQWEPTAWFQCIVGRDWRIRYDSAHYSVPYGLIGQTVQVRVTSQFLHVFFEHQQVAHHPRAKLKGEYQRNTYHAPPLKEAVLNCTREGLLLQAQELGMLVHQFCETLLSDPHIDKLRPVRCLLRLALTYEASRLDKACGRALAYKTIQYRSVKDILEKRLDQEPLLNPTPKTMTTNFKFARNPQEYRGECQEDISWISG